MRIISVSLPTAEQSKTRSGPMRRRFRRWRKSPAIWRSIRTRSRSRSWLEGQKIVARISEAKSGVAVTFVAGCRGACHRAALRADPLAQPATVASHPEDREPQDQQDQEDHDEDIKQEAGDIR